MLWRVLAFFAVFPVVFATWLLLPKSWHRRIWMPADWACGIGLHLRDRDPWWTYWRRCPRCGRLV
jgi:hypothetical protein